MHEEQNSGPHLAMALLCDRVLQERDGVLSLIRVVDRFTIPGTTKEMPPSPLQTTLVIAFKSGATTGKHTVKLRPVKPSGESMPEQEFPALFEGRDRGIGIVAQIAFMLDEEGLYWIDVFFEEAVVTRIPMMVLYQRVAQASRPEASHP